MPACSRHPDDHPAAASGDGGNTAATPQKEVELTEWSWRASGLSGSMQAGFTISNHSKYPVKDIVVVCAWKSVSGKVLGTAEKTLPDTWEPGETRAVGYFTIGTRDEDTASSEGTIRSWTAVTPAGETKMK